MKYFSFIAIIIMAVMSVSCSKEHKANVYNPDGSKSSLASFQSENDSDSVLQSDNIRLTYLFSGNNISESATEILSSRVVSAVASNGLGCIAGDPCFILLANISKLNESISATTPTKYSVKFSLNFYVGNYITGKIYESYSTEIMGVAGSKEKAELAAMRSFKNSTRFSKMLYNATEKIKEYYQTDSIGFFNIVKILIDGGKYAMAYSMLANVPSELGAFYQTAQSMLPNVHQKWMQQNTSDAISQMTILSADYTQFNPDIVAIYNSIPESSPLKGQAKEILDDYTKKYEEHTKETIDHKRMVEKEELAIEKLNAQLNVEANEELLNLYRDNYHQSGICNQKQGSSFKLPFVAGPFSPLVETALNSGINFLFNKYF